MIIIQTELIIGELSDITLYTYVQKLKPIFETDQIFQQLYDKASVCISWQLWM